MDLAKWVRDARAHGHLTMQQLADRLHLTRGTIFHWEHGNHRPSFEQVHAIATITGYPAPGAKPQPGTPASVADLTGREGMLLAWFRLMDEDQQRHFLNEVREKAATYTARPATHP